jgi:hypothetical protein
MKFRKITSQSNHNPKRLNSRRRSFLWQTGAAVSAVFASAAAGMARPGAQANTTLQDQVERLSGRLGILEDENAIRELHRYYGYYLDKGMHREIVELFADAGAVVFNGGIFMGKEQGVRRLYVDYFGRGFTGGRHGPVHGFLLDHTQTQNAVEIAADRNTAIARFHCLMQARAPVDPDSPHLDMARLQGQDIVQWWEGGIYENTYVKHGSVWKIQRLEYRPVWQADYAQGRAYGRPGYIRPFARTWPEDPIGPDRLIPPVPEQPGGLNVVSFQQPHPVTEKLWKT